MRSILPTTIAKVHSQMLRAHKLGTFRIIEVFDHPSGQRQAALLSSGLIKPNGERGSFKWVGGTPDPKHARAVVEKANDMREAQRRVRDMVQPPATRRSVAAPRTSTRRGGMEVIIAGYRVRSTGSITIDHHRAHLGDVDHLCRLCLGYCDRVAGVDLAMDQGAVASMDGHANDQKARQTVPGNEGAG